MASETDMKSFGPVRCPCGALVPVSNEVVVEGERALLRLPVKMLFTVVGSVRCRCCGWDVPIVVFAPVGVDRDL